MQESREQIIEKSVLSKGITRLCHFTNVNNLASILKYGLLSRKKLNTNECAYSLTDKYRTDRCENAICLSIMHPNYQMFDKVRAERPFDTWCVIAFETRILWEKNCAFCTTNAASNKTKKILMKDKKSPEAFEKMFEEKIVKKEISRKFFEFKLREKIKINSFYPTDPQAEVLCFDDIEPNLIQYVAFSSPEVSQEHKIYDKTKPMLFSEYLFSQRADHTSRNNAYHSPKTA